jgi:aryl-alcohol dehydrogenase-like predicted oxidoreductase
VAQLDDNLRAVEVKLPDELLAQLSEVSAPELRYPYDFIKRTDGSW